ncbi:hypothetical protein ACQCWI_04900 [Bacillus thuringiensis]|uniref:hypothetical protein n=1 Tax=Bacillus cereus group TaxID=86661 RepID=UPI001CEFAAD6|nr:hypothetical protein [Bacillus cereus]
MYVVPELTTGYRIVTAFQTEYTIRKAKRRIDASKNHFDLWLKANNTGYGALNDVILTKNLLIKIVRVNTLIHLFTNIKYFEKIHLLFKM